MEGTKTDLLAAEKYGTSEKANALRQDLAAALHERDRASLPGIIDGIRAHNDAEEWDAAIGDCTRAKAIDSEFDGLTQACAAAAEGQRVASIPTWIDAAKDVAGDEDRCSTPVDIAAAWKDLRQIKPDDPGYKKAQAAANSLEKCRKKSEREFSKGIRDIMVHQREDWAQNYETNLLDQGLDVRVKLSGKHKTQAKVRWVLLSRASVHQIVRDGTFLAALEKIGFEKVTFTDGFYESWWYELNPQSEEDGGKTVLMEFGLDKPLSL